MNRKTLPLSESYPDLSAEWHPTKNEGLTPQDVTPGSNKKVWWRCPHGHEWQATVCSRVHGSGCPICAGNQVLAGFNDLASHNPSLAAEWHPTKNGDLTPKAVTPGSRRKVWWRCAKGHEWQARITDRSNNNGCPICAGRFTESIASTHPTLAAEWHPTKNGVLMPVAVTSGSNRKVWWRCAKGHEWRAAVSNRVRGTGCPICAGKKVLSGYNDLASQYPTLAAEWNFQKNGNLTPKDVVSGSARKVWWRCQYGHEWETTVYERALRKSGCPICSKKRVFVGTNDLASQYPILASEWHPTMNGELTPQDISAGSGRKVWWQCHRGHVWEAVVFSRTLQGNGCPICAGKKVLAGYNDLASQCPAIAAEWHPTKNGDLTPKGVTSGSGRKVWWCCANGHEWQETIRGRVNGRGCPACAREQR